MYDRCAHTNLIHAKLHKVSAVSVCSQLMHTVPSASINASRPLFICLKFSKPIVLTKNSVQRGIDSTLLTGSSSTFSLASLVKPPASSPKQLSRHISVYRHFDHGNTLRQTFTSTNTVGLRSIVCKVIQKHYGARFQFKLIDLDEAGERTFLGAILKKNH